MKLSPEGYKTISDILIGQLNKEQEGSPEADEIISALNELEQIGTY